MGKCNDLWCENYNLSTHECDRCIKNESNNDKTELHVILKRRALEQMELSRPVQPNEQSR